MDRSDLIRNNPNVSPEVRDPEAVLSRLGHFWDSHGLSKQVLDPRGPMNMKMVTFHEDSAAVPDSRPNMPSRPNAATIRDAKFSLGIEGGLSARDVRGLDIAIFNRTKRDESDEAYDDALLDGIDLLAPATVYKQITAPMTRQPRPETILRTMQNKVDTIPQSGSSSDFWNIYDKHRKERQSGLSNSGIPHRWVRQNIDRLRDTEDYEIGVEEFDRSQLVKAHSDNPSHIGVYFNSSKGNLPSYDRIDLNTGTWARLNPDEFFPV